MMLVIALFSGLGFVSMGQDLVAISLTLGPDTATNPVGTTHTVTVKALDLNDPVPNLEVRFDVISGPNVGTTGIGMTDASGQATFTYTDIGGAGVDEIQASTIPQRAEPIRSNIVKKEWVAITKGFMTGGGSIFQRDGTRVTHGFELQCDKTKSPNNLEVNWGNGNKFHLEELTSAQCHDNPSIEPNPPKAGFDTYKGSGIGRYNGVDGATASWKFTDAGEPGKDDTASISITDVNGNIVLSVSGKLDKGNQQAHK